MANGGRTRVNVPNAARLQEAMAPNMKGADIAGEVVVSARKGNRSAVTLEAGKRLWAVISASAGQKAALIAAFLKNAPQRLKAVATKHGVEFVGRQFGFKNDKDFLEYLALRIEEMKRRDPSAAEFLKGSVGRQNAFLGGLLELSIKYGPFRKIILALTDDSRKVINAEIDARAASGGYSMRNANNAAVLVKDKFAAPLMANLLEVETADGPKAFVDFAGLSMNKTGQWAFPLPVEIKMPRAAASVGAQMAAMVERLSEAMANGKKVFAYFSTDDFAALEKLMGKGAVLGTEIRDGREMLKVALDPKLALFNSDNIYGSLSRNHMLVRPNSKFWNPADPSKVPAASPEMVFSIATINGRPVPVEMSSSSAISGKKQGFNFWRVLVPVQREFLIDVYRALFAADK